MLAELDPHAVLGVRVVRNRHVLGHPAHQRMRAVDPGVDHGQPHPAPSGVTVGPTRCDRARQQQDGCRSQSRAVERLGPGRQVVGCGCGHRSRSSSTLRRRAAARCRSADQTSDPGTAESASGATEIAPITSVTRSIGTPATPRPQRALRAVEDGEHGDHLCPRVPRPGTHWRDAGMYPVALGGVTGEPLVVLRVTDGERMAGGSGEPASLDQRAGRVRRQSRRRRRRRRPHSAAGRRRHRYRDRCRLRAPSHQGAQR